MVVKFEKKEGTTLFMKKDEALSKFEDLMIFQYGEKAMTSRMFPFITKTWSPIAGGPCPYDCYRGGCWATVLKNKWDNSAIAKKYSGPFRIHEPAMKPWFKPNAFVFVQGMSDIGAPGIPRGIIIDVLEAIKFYEAKGIRFLMLTKNPRFYMDWQHHLSPDTTLGATIETDWAIPSEISKAPPPFDRLACMEWCADNLPNDRFICVEPIMKCSPNFERDIMKIRPKFMAVGYDNYKNKLPEPSLVRTEILIKYLADSGVKVFRKTLRDPLPSKKA